MVAPNPQLAISLAFINISFNCEYGSNSTGGEGRCCIFPLTREYVNALWWHTNSGYCLCIWSLNTGIWGLCLSNLFQKELETRGRVWSVGVRIIVGLHVCYSLMLSALYIVNICFKGDSKLCNFPDGREKERKHIKVEVALLKCFSIFSDLSSSFNIPMHEIPILNVSGCLRCFLLEYFFLTLALCCDRMQNFLIS